MDKKKTIFEKMLKAVEDCPAIPENGFNSFQKFKFQQWSDVFPAVKKSLHDNGLLFTFGSSGLPVVTFGKTAKGAPQVHIIAGFKCTIIDAATGGKIESEVIGEATDTGDKALRKASTSAVKEFFLKTFMIPTSDMQDNDASSSDSLGSPQRATSKPEPEQTPQQTEQASLTKMAAEVKQAASINDCSGIQEKWMQYCKNKNVTNETQTHGLNIIEARKRELVK